MIIFVKIKGFFLSSDSLFLTFVEILPPMTKNNPMWPKMTPLWQLTFQPNTSLVKTKTKGPLFKFSIQNLSMKNTTLANCLVNSQAVGMDSWVRVFVIILEFTLTFIFESKIHEKKFLDTKIISFSKADF